MEGRKTPGDFASKEEFALLLKKRHVEEFKAEAERNKMEANSVLKVMVWKELHSDGHDHLYAAILCDRPYAVGAIQKSLQTKDKVYLSFGTDHSFFWTEACARSSWRHI